MHLTMEWSSFRKFKLVHIQTDGRHNFVPMHSLNVHMHNADSVNFIYYILLVIVDIT
jgi:hypothetical protein